MGYAMKAIQLHADLWVVHGQTGGGYLSLMPGLLADGKSEDEALRTAAEHAQFADMLRRQRGLE